MNVWIPLVCQVGPWVLYELRETSQLVYPFLSVTVAVLRFGLTALVTTSAPASLQTFCAGGLQLVENADLLTVPEFARLVPSVQVALTVSVRPEAPGAVATFWVNFAEL